jgi:hypothetical protein
LGRNINGHRWMLLVSEKCRMEHGAPVRPVCLPPRATAA